MGLTKSEARKARKAARAENRPLTGELSLGHNTDPAEFTESARGLKARERWARRYDDLNGAPESERDR